MASFIINTDPRWIAYLFSNGIRNPVFWLKRSNSPSSTAVLVNNPIFFRVTKTNPPVIKGYGVIDNIQVCGLTDAFLKYGNRLGYSTMDEMIQSSSEWTSGVTLDPAKTIYCIEIRDFQVTQDTRTDTELKLLGIDFDHRYVVTGKAIDDAQTAALVNVLRTRHLKQIEALVSFIDTNIPSQAIEDFNPKDIQDAREKIARLVAKRRGQPEFRKKLILAYNSRCAISGCRAIAALEAVHIVPYKGPQTNHVSNGLLLRADLHTLFDVGLLAIDSTNMTVLVHPALASTEYEIFAGKSLTIPTSAQDSPNKQALDIHRTDAGL